MRLISQDGMIDVPYDKIVVKVTEHPFKMVISALFEREDCMKDIVMGYYSTEAKALKVMEMLRNAYVGMPVIMQNVEVADEVIEKLKKQNVIYATLPEEKSRIDYANNAIFKFPADEEVEV